MAALLEATGLVKRFGGTVALDGFDLAVAAREITGLGRAQRGGQFDLRPDHRGAGEPRRRDRCGSRG